MAVVYNSGQQGYVYDMSRALSALWKFGSMRGSVDKCVVVRKYGPGILSPYCTYEKYTVGWCMILVFGVLIDCVTRCQGSRV